MVIISLFRVGFWLLGGVLESLFVWGVNGYQCFFVRPWVWRWFGSGDLRALKFGTQGVWNEGQLSYGWNFESPVSLLVQIILRDPLRCYGESKNKLCTAKWVTKVAYVKGVYTWWCVRVRQEKKNCTRGNAVPAIRTRESFLFFFGCIADHCLCEQVSRRYFGCASYILQNVKYSGLALRPKWWKGGRKKKY